MKKFLAIFVALMVALLPVLAFAADKTNTKVTLTASTSDKEFELLSKLKIEASIDRGENPAVAFNLSFDGNSLVSLRVWPSKDFKTLYGTSNFTGDKIFSVDIEDLIGLITLFVAELENQLGGINLASIISEEAISEGIEQLFSENKKEAAAIEKLGDDLLSELVGSIDLSKLNFEPVLKSIEALVAKATEEDAKDVNVEFSTDKLGLAPDYSLNIKEPVAKIGKLVLEKSDISSIIGSILETINSVISIIDTKEVVKIVDEFLDKELKIKNIELKSFTGKDGKLIGVEVRVNDAEGKDAASLSIDFATSADAEKKLNKYAFRLNVSPAGEAKADKAVQLLTAAIAVSSDKATPDDGFVVISFGAPGLGQIAITIGQKTDAATKDNNLEFGLNMSAEGKNILSGKIKIAVKESGSFNIAIIANDKEVGALDAKVEKVDSVPNPDTKDAIAIIKLNDEEKAALVKEIETSATGALFGAMSLLAA